MRPALLPPIAALRATRRRTTAGGSSWPAILRFDYANGAYNYKVLMDEVDYDAILNILALLKLMKKKFEEALGELEGELGELEGEVDGLAGELDELGKIIIGIGRGIAGGIEEDGRI